MLASFTELSKRLRQLILHKHLIVCGEGSVDYTGVGAPW